MGRPLTAEQSLKFGFSVNKRLYKNLMIWRNAVLNQDIDCACIVDGNEGAGKSCLAPQLGVILDGRHQVDLRKQVHWNPEKIKVAIRTLPPNSAIISDESARWSDRRMSASQVNIEFNKLLRECRQYNQFLIFVLPSFYDMDMVAAVWRTRFLVHTWYDWDLSDLERPLQRGFYRFYSERGKKNLYTNKYYRTRYEYPLLKNECFDASFPHHWVFDHEEYKLLKRRNEREDGHGMPAGPDVAKIIYTMKEKGLLGGSLSEVAEMLGVHRNTLQQWHAANSHGRTHNKTEG